MNPRDDLEPIWKALANPVRREILDILREGPLPTGEVVMRFGDLSRFAVMQHLRVLEEARLVIPRKEGRVKMNHLNAVPIRMIYERWVSRYEGAWASSLTGLKRAAEGGSRDEQPDRSSPEVGEGRVTTGCEVDSHG